jgi:hypothetical protein
MAGLVDAAEKFVKGQAKKHTKTATGKAKAAATTANGGKDASGTGTDTDVQSQVDAVLAANPPSWLFLLGALGILGVGGAAGYVIWRAVRPSDFMPSSNYAIYAGLFIMALAIERVLEPFSGYIVPSTTMKKARAKATAAQVTRVKAVLPAQHAANVAAETPVQTEVGTDPPEVGTDPPEAPTPPAQPHVPPRVGPTGALATAQSQAAVASKEQHRSQANRAVLMWAIASTLAMVICAWVGIFLLRSVETPSSTAATAAVAKAASGPTGGQSPTSLPNRWVDLVVTGLVVGAGTKPLHDLISNIQTSSGNSKSSSS